MSKETTRLRDRTRLCHYVYMRDFARGDYTRLVDFKERACVRILNLNSAIINRDPTRGTSVLIT